MMYKIKIKKIIYQIYFIIQKDFKKIDKKLQNKFNKSHIKNKINID